MATAPVVVALTGAAALIVVRETGGPASDFQPLLFLPVLFAVIGGDFTLVLCTGALLSVLSLFAMHPGPQMGTFTRTDAVRAIVINGMAIAGALYARSVSRERTTMRRTVEEKEALLNASQIVSSAERLEYAIDSALLLIPRLTPRFRCAAIFFVDETLQQMELYDVLGLDRSVLSFERFNLNNGVGWNANDARPLYIRDTQSGPASRLGALDPGARSVLCVGLRSPNPFKAPTGMLFVSAEEPDAFGESQIDLLQSFADRIAFPLQKIRMQEGLEGLAFTDALTGLYNFRYFRAHLEDELKRSVRYRRPLSLLMLDLDGFKAINDRYGHQAGDNLLAGIARIIRATVRETDLPARYGGEEFAIISPETMTSDAHTLAERIRAAVAASSVTVDGGVSVTATVSIGVATWPMDADDEASLIAAADGALYEAKRAGKDRVVTARSVESVVPTAS